MSSADATRMIDLAGAVHLDDSIRSYIVRLAAASRSQPELRLGISTRGAIAVMRVARTLAAAQGRVYVTVDDVKAIAHPVMAHRMLLTAESELRQVRTEDLVDRLLDRGDRAFDTPLRAKAYAEAQQIIAADSPYILLFSGDVIFATLDDIRGLQITPLLPYRLGIHRLYRVDPPLKTRR